jgi:hypothetical protein
MTTPITTSTHASPTQAARNTANLAVNPLVSGTPAKAARKKVNTTAVTGDRLASPAHWERWVASPAASRTRVTTANAPMVEKP